MQDGQGQRQQDKGSESGSGVQTAVKDPSPSPVGPTVAAEISPRKIAVPVLVKDGKPCGDTSPLTTPNSTPPEAIAPHHHTLGLGSNLSPLPDIKTHPSALLHSHANMTNQAAGQPGPLFGQGSAFTNSFGGLGSGTISGFAPGATMGYGGMAPNTSTPAYYAMRGW